jgi:hypothetical protein
MDFSDPSLRTRYEVPSVKCDVFGFVSPDSAERRFQDEYTKDCASFFDPAEALAPVRPRKPARQPCPGLVEAALSPLWTRTNFSCSDPVAFDKFKSETYPLPADVVRDTRTPLNQVGSQARLDGRDPVDVYRKLGHEAVKNFDALASYPGYY